MSLDWVRDVETFQHKMGRPVRTTPGIARDLEMRLDLIQEEWMEVEDAALILSSLSNSGKVFRAENLAKAEADALVALADGLADLIYVSVGLALESGIDLRPVWDEVHKTNMAKEAENVREDGKILKPEGWRAPDIATALQKGKLHDPEYR